MFNIVFYENKKGQSEIWNFLEQLRKHGKNSKDSRIQYNQIILYIQLLQDNGTRMPETITKHLVEDIWELRPGKNRVIYFVHTGNEIVLLHCFQKKTQKTPRRELERAIAERNDYLQRKENDGL